MAVDGSGEADTPTLLMLDSLLTSIHSSRASGNRRKRESNGRRRLPDTAAMLEDSRVEQTMSGAAARSAHSPPDDSSAHRSRDAPRQLQGSLVRRNMSSHHGSEIQQSLKRVPADFARRVRQMDERANPTDYSGSVSASSESNVRSSGAPAQPHVPRGLSDRPRPRNGKSTVARPTGEDQILAPSQQHQGPMAFKPRQSRGSKQVSFAQEASRPHAAVAQPQGPNSPVLFESSRSHVSQAHTADDRVAVETFKSFEGELKTWVRNQGLSDPPHRLSAFANHLNDHYLCTILDPLKSSPVVTSIRKRVARRIEDVSAGRNPIEADERERTQGRDFPAPAHGLEAQKQMALDAQEKRSAWQKPMPTKPVAQRTPAHWTCATCSKKNERARATCCVCGRPHAVPAPSKGKAANSPPRPNAPPRTTEREDTSAYSTEEREKVDRLVKAQDDYKSFVTTKLRLDNHAQERETFAQEIEDVLKNFKFSEPISKPKQSGPVSADEKRRGANPFLVQSKAPYMEPTESVSPLKPT